MSDIHMRNIQAFIQLLETRPSLFSDHGSALNDLETGLTEDIEQMSDAIEKWYEARVDIFKAHLEISKTLAKNKPGNYRGAGGTTPPPLPEEDMRKELINALRRYRPSKPYLTGKPRGDKNPIKG